MNVIGAKTITRSARRWLLEHEAIIERHRGVWIVFLPDTLIITRSQHYNESSMITIESWKKLPPDQQWLHRLWIEPKADDKRTIYSEWNENEV